MSLAARDVTVRRGSRAVLDSVNAELRAGELLGVLGPNGAGKTTLLRAWAGLITPDRGAILLEGRGLAAIKPGARARQIAYLPQDGQAAWNLSVAEIVALGRMPHAGEDGGAVQRALEAVGAAQWRERAMATLSGGEMQRVLLARALAVEAPFLLADEPVASLDPRFQLIVLELLQARTRAGHGIAVVMHDLALAMRFCDRLILLDQGRVAAEGAPAAVLDGPRLRAVYGIEALRGEAGGRSYILPWQVEKRP